MTSSFFQDKDFKCKCSNPKCEAISGPEIRALADTVRKAWKRPLVIVSGARCAERTADLRKKGIKAALKSAHNEFIAIDIVPVDKTLLNDFKDFCVKHLEEWGCWMEDPDFTTMWVHLDLRARKNRIFKP